MIWVKGQSEVIRGHEVKKVKKLQEFLFAAVNRVEFFNLNWNNAFCLRTCVFFFVGIKGH